MKALDKTWRDLAGNDIAEFRQTIKTKLKTKKYSLHVGTDTKPRSDGTVMITTICFRESGKGVIAYYQKTTMPPFASVLDRLLQEAVVSLEVAEDLKAMTGMVPTVHADVNPNEENLSNRVITAIMGMVTGMGYPVLVKPEAWAADIADMYTR